LLQQSKMLARQALIRAIYARLASSHGRQVEIDQNRGIERILVIRPDHLGDLLFATPSLERLRQAFPNAHITGAVGPWGRAMWEGNPNLDALEVIPFPGITGKTGGGPLAPYVLLGRSARRLARGRYDLAIILRFDHWWGAALAWAVGIPRRWGYDTPGMGAWLTGGVPYVAGRHEVEQNLRLAEGVTRAFSSIKLPPVVIDRDKGMPALTPPKSSPPSEGLLKGWLEAPKRAVIHPGTAAANKLWTISGWAEVADTLVSQGWSVALTGSMDERKLTDIIIGRAKSKPLNLAGKTASFGQLVWVLEQAQMVLGVDNGPLHIADALGKPTVHLYGPSGERIWGPWGDPQKHRVFRAPSTWPTMQLDVGSTAPEGGPEMRAIMAEMVMGEIGKLPVVGSR
jgi:ADP-heptose:LPS heptosyltransferase